MALCKKFEVKGGRYVKKLEFDQMKKFLFITQSKPYVLSRYYGCDSVIPVVIPSKLKISFQARKSPRGAWSTDTI